MLVNEEVPLVGVDKGVGRVINVDDLDHDKTYVGFFIRIRLVATNLVLLTSYNFERSLKLPLAWLRDG